MQMEENAPGRCEGRIRRKGDKKSEETVTAPLYEEIGRLKMELDWLKKSKPLS